MALIGQFGSSSTGETEVVQLTLSNSTSSTSVNQLPGGTYNVQAHYEGDGTFVPSDSPMTKVTILPEPSTATAAALTGTPPNLTSFSAQVYGNPLYLQATVTGKSGVGTPTGTINFSDSIQGSLGSVTLDDTGTATTQNLVQFVDGGSRAVTASYSGDASFKSGSSAAVNFTLTTAPTTTSIQIPSNVPLVFGSNPQIIAEVSTSSYGQAPTGSVAAFVGGTQVGISVNVEPGGLNVPTANSFAYLGLSSLPPGQSTVTVKYTSADSNYLGSTCVASRRQHSPPDNEYASLVGL